MIKEIFKLAFYLFVFLSGTIGFFLGLNYLEIKGIIPTWVCIAIGLFVVCLGVAMVCYGFGILIQPKKNNNR